MGQSGSSQVDTTPPDCPPPECSRPELYKIYRDYLQHEDGLINYRLTWNLSGQTFLFAAFGLSLGKLADLQEKMSSSACAADTTLTVVKVALPAGEANVLWYIAHCVLPPLGISLAIVSFLGIRAAQNALINLEEIWDASEKVYDTLHRTDRVAPDLQRAIDDIKEKDIGASDSRLHPVLPKLTGGGVKNSTRLGTFISAATPGFIGFGWLVLFILGLSLKGGSTQCFRPTSPSASASGVGSGAPLPPLPATAINFQPSFNLQPSITVQASANIQPGVGHRSPCALPSCTPPSPPASASASAPKPATSVAP